MSLEWKPIETAPRVYHEDKDDDWPILLLTEYGPQLCGWWQDDEMEDNQGWYQWLSGNDYGLPVHGEPTHWCEVPKRLKP
jgi:hypothetical protein